MPSNVSTQEPPEKAVFNNLRFLSRPKAIQEIVSHLLRPDQCDEVAAVYEALAGGKARPERIQVPRLKLETCGIWYQCHNMSEEEFYTPTEIEALMVEALENTDIEKLAWVYSRVMRIAAHVGKGPDLDAPGIWVLDETERFVCRQCGHCCQDLTDAFNTVVMDEDVNRWRLEDRNDILNFVTITHTGSKVWTDPQTGDFLSTCPWLQKDDATGKYACLIHSTKPTHCAGYPHTKRHAFNTGCPGFDLRHE